MTNNSKGKSNGPSSQKDATRATLVGVVGIYMLYLGYQVMQGTLSGASSMSMTVTVLSVAFLAISGLGTIAYALRIWRGYKNGQKSEEDDETEDAE